MIDGSEEREIMVMRNALQIIWVEQKTTNNYLDNVLSDKETNRLLVSIEVRVDHFLG